MTIGTGDPPQEGRYACFYHGLTVATVVLVWIGTEWFDGARRPVARHSVAGWIGPLPEWLENRAGVPEHRIFDL